MEGYTNVIGSQYDFDDLDIEGRVVDEWNAEDEGKNTLDNVKGQKLVDERAILSERVTLDSGHQTDVFSVVKKNGQVWYTCHICSDTVVGLSLLKQHVETNKHRTNLSNPVHPRAKFVKLDPKENLALEPGEPVPPGLEEMIIKPCLIQPKLDACKASPLIGLEYLVELTQSTLDTGVYYYCLLCEKTGIERNIFIHLTSIFHYMKYLSIYFPTVARKLHTLRNKQVKKSFGLVVTEIVADIEAKYGRMKPRSETHAEFLAPGRKAELGAIIHEAPHIREKDGDTFAEKATAENVDKKTRELQYAPPATSKNEDRGKVEENELSGSMFNKNNRISVDKKQLRPREEEANNSSPDVQIVDIQLPTAPAFTEKDRLARSKSLSSISTISSSSSNSKDRARYDSRYRHQSKISNSSRSYRNWSRSRSRSPSYRYRRRGSPSYMWKYSPGKHSRDRSPRRWNRGDRRDSHGRSPDRYKFKGTDRYGRSRDKYDGRNDKYRREKITEGKRSPKEYIHPEEKMRWSKFREDLEKVENVKLEQLKYHEKNPEKHPQYPEEWKAFWNRRYNELQRSGVDPSKHDFKPEWISFWTKRMKELYEEELGKAKDELKKKFDLPDDPQYLRENQWKYNQRKRNNSSPSLVDVSPPTPDKKDVIADIKTTWKAFTGSDIKDTPKRPLSPWEDESKTRDMSPPMKREARRHSPRSRSQSPTALLLEDMPQRKTRTSSLIFVLRKLTVLEQQLGSSLAPKVFEILSQSLALEKIKEDASLDLLFEVENCVFLETVREKLIALLCAGVVPRNVVNTARSAIKHIDIALYLSSKRERSVPIGSIKTAIGGVSSSQKSLPNQYIVQPKSEPVAVPGVGQVDKVAIAQQIAVALIEQGKTNVTEGELEQLINAVVGMAEASVNSAHPMTTAGFLHQLQSMQNTATSNILTIPGSSMETTGPVFKQSPILSRDQTKIQDMSNSQPQAACGALKLLQSAYNDTIKNDHDSPKPDIVEVSAPDSIHISDTELASTLTLFNNTSKEDQPGFVHRLKITNPEMYKRLCPFIPSSFVIDSERSKRSPITIPISKERSEPRIKPLSSGRLSPFSSRSGGANPTIGEKVIIDDDDDDGGNNFEKDDVKFVTDTSSNPQVSKQDKEISKLKFSNSDKDDDDVDGDDDDDDYSFEDVYKAAQEKLRQKLVNEEKKSNQFLEKKESEKPEDFGNDIVKDSSQVNTDKCHENVLSDSTAWSSNRLENDMFAASENFQQQKQSKEDNLRKHSVPSNRIQHSFQSDVQRFNETSFQTNQPTPYQQTLDTSSTLDPPETTLRRQQSNQQYSVSQSSFDGNLHQSYQNQEQYLNEPVYSQTNAAFYDKSDPYPRDPLYSSNNEPYNYPQRDHYATSYRDPYNLPYDAQAKPGLSQNMSSYGDQYSYRQPEFVGDSYTQARPPVRSSQAGFPSAPPSRYPDPAYPSY